MYIITPILIVLFFILALLNYHRRKRAIQQVSELSYTRKCEQLNALCAPFGFTYQFVQDVFSVRADAWQKELGYGEFYDQEALSMNMDFDCEPVYFNYLGKTWLIEFWKGQYGINTGAEAGIYHADSLVAPMLRPQTIFKAANEEEAIPIHLHLLGPNCPFFSLSKQQWWVSGFVMGTHTQPEDLTLEVSLTFPDEEMCTAFARAMYGLGYKNSELLICQKTVQFYFTRPKAAPIMPPAILSKKYIRIRNSLLCDLYLWITEPFPTTADRLLYLYYTHPFILNQILCIRMFKKHCRKKP